MACLTLLGKRATTIREIIPLSPIIALGTTDVALKKNRSTYWGGSIPKMFDDTLTGRQKTLPKPTIIESGDADNFYVQFSDGNSMWSGGLPHYLKGFLKAGNINTIALGQPGSFYSKNESGYNTSENLPKGLDNAITGRKKSLRCVHNVNLGPNGEWFIGFMDGSWSLNGHSERCHEVVNNLKGSGRKIKEILLGADGMWMIRYD